jgi:predicted PurR-regulated permease PerM
MSPNREFVRVEISWHTLWKLLIFSLLVLGAYLARDVLGIFCVAVVLSLALDPLIAFLERKGVKRFLGTAITFLSGAFLLALASYFLLPIISIEASNFLKSIHEITYNIFGIGLPENLVDALTFGRDKLFAALASADISIAGTLASILLTAISFIATILIAFYLCIERDGTDRLLRILLPDRFERPVLKVFDRFKIKIRKWFIAQFYLSFAMGFIVTIGLWILGVRYALLLGLLAMVFELVPMIGPILLGVVACLVAISDSLGLAISVAIFFIVIHQVENHILTPAIIGKTMKVHPVVVVVALLAGGKIAGFIGVILAVPLAVLAQEVFNYLAEKKDKRQGMELDI